MLDAINQRRAAAGLLPVELGHNVAAQLHAEASLANCSSSHWGPDGTKPYMRYTLAGGRQTNAENVSGLNYCVKQYDGYAPIESVESMIDQAMSDWMHSPGHRDNVLNPTHRKVNVGLAWNRYNIMLVQHFEGDYVEYDALPAIDGGVLALSGRFKNGATGWWADGYYGLGLQLRYDPPPAALTGGQLAATYCYDYGAVIAFVLPPPPEGRRYTGGIRVADTACADPYSVDASRGPTSYHEAKAAAEYARDKARWTPPDVEGMVVPILEAETWRVSEDSFEIEARLPGFLMVDRNPGVYTVMLWADVGGRLASISEYAIWVGVDPPDAYRARY